MQEKGDFYMKNLSFDYTKINDGFWNFYNKLNRKSVVKNVYTTFISPTLLRI